MQTLHYLCMCCCWLLDSVFCVVLDIPEEINTHINKPQHHQTSHAPSSLHHAQPQSQSHHHNSHMATSQTPITNNQHHQQHQHQNQQVNNHHTTSHYQTPTNMNNPSAVFVQHEQSTIANQQGGYASNVPTSSYHHGYPPGAQTPTHGGHHHAGHGGIGKISDYDPLTDQPRNSPYSARQSSTVIYTSNQGAGMCSLLSLSFILICCDILQKLFIL